MLIVEMLLALLLATGVTSVLVAVRPRDGAPARVLFAFFFVMVFPLIWAAGTWMTPIGPSPGGVAWLGFVLVSLFLLLLILAAVPPEKPRRRSEDTIVPENARRETIAGTALFFGVFFWLLLIATAAALIARYVTL